MKYHINCLGILICLLLLVEKTSAQSVQVEAKLDKASILMGDQTTLRLNVSTVKNTEIIFPALGDTLSSKVQIVKVGKTDTLNDKTNPDLLVLSRAYTITSFDPGIQMVPILTVKSKEKLFSTRALALEVVAVKVDTTKAIYDIKEPLAVSYTWLDWLKDNWLTVVISLATVALIIGLIWYYIKRKQKKPAFIPAKPAIPPHRVALEKLNLLQEKHLWENNQVKTYYSELTEILRDYLEKRYKIKALEQTTEEIIESLSSTDLPKNHKDKLNEVLLLSDLVKFAKGLPLADENKESMNLSIAFIKATQLSENSALKKESK
jgi:hypothetical protein